MHQVRLPVSTRTLQIVSEQISARRKRIGSRWRKVTPGTQAIIVPAVLRPGLQRQMAKLSGHEIGPIWVLSKPAK